MFYIWLNEMFSKRFNRIHFLKIKSAFRNAISRKSQNNFKTISFQPISMYLVKYINNNNVLDLYKYFPVTTNKKAQNKEETSPITGKRLPRIFLYLFRRSYQVISYIFVLKMGRKATLNCFLATMICTTFRQ